MRYLFVFFLLGVYILSLKQVKINITGFVQRKIKGWELIKAGIAVDLRHDFSAAVIKFTQQGQYGSNKICCTGSRNC